MVLDFLGKAIVAKLFFCDTLLSIIMHTELQNVTTMQVVMREEVRQLREMDDGAFGESASVTPADSATGPLGRCSRTAYRSR